MASKTESEKPRETSGSEYEEPREKTDPSHKDAGQEYVEREENQTGRKEAG